jgi:hypothetical protein
MNKGTGYRETTMTLLLTDASSVPLDLPPEDESRSSSRLAQANAATGLSSTDRTEEDSSIQSPTQTTWTHNDISCFRGRRTLRGTDKRRTACSWASPCAGTDLRSGIIVGGRPARLSGLIYF